VLRSGSATTVLRCMVRHCSSCIFAEADPCQSRQPPACACHWVMGESSPWCGKTGTCHIWPPCCYDTPARRRIAGRIRRSPVESSGPTAKLP
jgi:hypothetical protein